MIFLYEYDCLLTISQSPTQAWSAGCLIDLYMDAIEEQEAGL